MGVPIPVKVEVMESTMQLWKGTISGSIEGEHTIECFPKDGGCEVTLEFTYTIQNSVLNKIANTAIAEKLIENSLGHTLQNLKTICEIAEEM